MRTAALPSNTDWLTGERDGDTLELDPVARGGAAVGIGRDMAATGGSRCVCHDAQKNKRSNPISQRETDVFQNPFTS
jgi:hypothetical protein